MSLSHFLTLKEVKKNFRDFYPKPPFTVKRDIRAHPLTKNNSLIGTAFDYLLRFYIKRHYPYSNTRLWVAEESLAFLKSKSKDMSYKEVYRHGVKVIKNAKANYKTYLNNGIITNELLTSVIHLSYLDPILRTGKIFQGMWIITGPHLDDLRNLISLVKPETFKVNKEAFLNPDFGMASKLLSADADLIIDDKLIDIKTVQDFTVTRERFNQLIGYYTLNYLMNEKNKNNRRKINHFGIYFSRHGYLHLYKVEDIIDISTFTDFAAGFVQTALKYYHGYIPNGS